MTFSQAAILWSSIILFAGQQPPPAQTELLRARVEQLRAAQTPPAGENPPPVVRGARLQRAAVVAKFLEARGFEAPWGAPGAAEQIRQAIAGIEQDGLAPADYHLAAIDVLLNAQRTAPSAANAADLQILLTDAIATMVDHVRHGKVRPASLDRRWNVNPRAGAPPLEQALTEIAGAASPGKAIEAAKPSHFIYTGLKRALADMRARAAQGGWGIVASGPALKPGATDARIAAVRKRLTAFGLDGNGADSTTYDAALEATVRRFQDQHRLTADGTIGAATLEALNVSAAARVDQLRVNLERARWVVSGLNDSFVLVNLPAFKVYIIRDRKNVWETRTQIGREARQTPTFRADMRYLVLNPDWTVPPTILAQDVLAGMKKGENTIAKKRLTILDRQGRPVDPASIDWATADAKSFPYVLRQPPGPDNALGRVKFIFPNEHAIFLHDTPSQELFGPDQRTFSSGCIRVQHALDLAEVLLTAQGSWNPERIKTVVDGGKMETVLLDDPLPVLIVYWTVSVGATGELRFARDVYRRDPPLLQALGSSR